MNSNVRRRNTTSFEKPFSSTLHLRLAAGTVAHRRTFTPEEGTMNFRLVCVLGLVVTGVFGLGFLLLPELVSSFYGISSWNPGTTFIARLYADIGISVVSLNQATQHWHTGSTRKRAISVFP